MYWGYKFFMKFSTNSFNSSIFYSFAVRSLRIPLFTILIPNEHTDANTL